MDLRRQIAVLRSHLLLIVAGVAISAGAAYVVSGFLPPTYEARAILIVGESLRAVNPDVGQLQTAQRLGELYAEVATTRPVLEGAAERVSPAVSADEVKAAVEVQAPRDSTLLTITARSTDARQAAAIANALAEQLISASPAIEGRQTDVSDFIQRDLLAVQEQIGEIQDEIETLVEASPRTDAQETRLDTLQGRLTSLRATYATLLQSYSSITTNTLALHERALVPGSPSAPKPLFNALIAGILGLLITATIAFLLDYLDDTVKRPEDVEELVALPTLGAINRLRGVGGRSEIYRLITLLYPRAPAAEAFRTLRTNIEFTSLDSPVRSLVVTSAAPSEGKTLVAANLAIVFAQAGHRTLLVDADLRRPTAHRLFDVANGDGLTTLLRDERLPVLSVAHATEEPNLRVVTSGPLPPNPAELISSQRMAQLIDRLKAEADLVILDSPPIQAVTDPALLAARVDGTLLVIHAAHTRRDVIQRARASLANVGARVLGVVLNVIPERLASDYYHYYGDNPTEEPGAPPVEPAHQPVPQRGRVAALRDVTGDQA